MDLFQFPLFDYCLKVFTFSAKIYKLGINPVVDPPDNVLNALFKQAGRSKGPIPVRGLLNGAEFIQTLVKYSGKWRLYINGEMLKTSGLKVSDEANVEIEYDPRPRVVRMPKELKNSLAKDKKANSAFKELSPSRRKEIVRYIGSMKTEASRMRSVERVIRYLKGEKADSMHAVMRRPKG